MPYHGKLYFIFFLLLVLCPVFCCAQRPAIKALVDSVDNFDTRVPSEKVFVQVDKPYYNVADTIWMKAYILDAALNYSQQSGLVYAELINDTGKVVLRQSMPVKLGISFGQLVLDEKNVADGNYTLRVYTNWMQNEGDQSFFSRQFMIGNTGDNAWTVSTEHKLTGTDSVFTTLHFYDANRKPLRLQDMRLKLMTGDHTLRNYNITTGVDGGVYIKFGLPENARSLHLLAEAGAGNTKVHRLYIPISVHADETADLQFMPEGGALVAGLQSRVAFKAINEAGDGTEVSGNILDKSGQPVAVFKSTHLGMGSFLFTPKPGGHYTAVLINKDEKATSYPLPDAKLSGITITFGNNSQNDTILLKASATPDVVAGKQSYYLLGRSRGKVCYAARLFFDSTSVYGKIAKEKFASGITRFTLFDDKMMPLAERIVFIDHHDLLNIAVTANKQSYTPKDSIALTINVTNADNKPVSGSFSMSVTDDSQIKADSTNIAGLPAYMLLTGDLKGTVEQPGYYFEPANITRYNDLDNLLLTQGWVGYDWKAVLDPAYQPKFRAEPEIAITGRISRPGGKKVNGLKVSLLSTKKPVLFRDTLSDVNGRFIFDNLPRIDTGTFMVQVKDNTGKMFEANVYVDEFIPAKAQAARYPAIPWYAGSDSTLLNNLAQTRAYNREYDKLTYPLGTKHLREVEIRDRKTVKGSRFYAGAGVVPDIVLNEEDLKKANKISLQAVLEQRVKGFKTATLPYGKQPVELGFVIDTFPINLSIDGFKVDEFYVPHKGFTDHYTYLQRYLAVLTAEDVRGIEVYGHYIEVTTWSGDGAFMDRVHGRYLYRPVPISWPKEFYKPKYAAKSNNILADLRPTIDWEPNIITDSTGKATVWFYAKSKASSYTAIINGADLNGNVGYSRFKIQVKAQ